jgi:hypothetical protein
MPISGQKVSLTLHTSFDWCCAGWCWTAAEGSIVTHALAFGKEFANVREKREAVRALLVAMKGQGPFTPTLPAPPGVVRRRATQTAASSGSPSGHVGTPMPMRLPGMAAPRSEPASSQDMERIRSRRPSQAPGKQAPATAVADKKQQQDLISSADSWSMTHEREEVRVVPRFF